jgi:hypothetical protein
VELAIQWKADVELEALQISAAQVWGMVLGSADGPSSLAASMSVAVEILKGQIDVAVTNRVHWGSRSTLVATVMHFPN